MNKKGILAGMALLIYFCAVTFQIIDGQSLHQSPFCGCKTFCGCKMNFKLHRGASMNIPSFVHTSTYIT